MEKKELISIIDSKSQEIILLSESENDVVASILEDILMSLLSIDSKSEPFSGLRLFFTPFIRNEIYELRNTPVLAYTADNYLVTRATLSQIRAIVES